MAQSSASGSSSSTPNNLVVWEPAPKFQIPKGLVDTRDVTAVPYQHGKLLVLGGLKENNDSTANTTTATHLIEWNTQRSFPFPPLQQPQEGRYGATAINWNNAAIFVAGGATHEGRVLEEVEQLLVGQAAGGKKGWQPAPSLSVPRLYATAVAIPAEQLIVVMGGRDDTWQELDTVDVAVVDHDSNTLQHWETLRNRMPAARMGCAACLLNESTLLVLGGYDGRSWQPSCMTYEFPMGDFHHGIWRQGTSIPDMPETVQFPKVVMYYKYILVIGEMMIPKQSHQHTQNQNTNNNNNMMIQCLDSIRREWLWAKPCQCPNLDMVALQEPFLYGISLCDQQSYQSLQSSSQQQPSSGGGVYVCELSALDPQMVSDVLPVAVGTTATADVEAPTIVAENAVLVAQDTSNPSTTPDDDPFNHEPNVKLRHVVRIQLSERSYYTGQLRRKDGTYVPHGQGLLVWLEEDKDGGATDQMSLASTETGQQNKGPSSYYKGQFLNGFRHGLGEMYLRAEDKHYFGFFEYGSWEGVGSMKIRNRGFSFFGHFVSGEMTGKGRCSYRVNEAGRWTQKTYSGGFQAGKAHGRGVIADYMTGRIEVDREFKEEDIFGLGQQGSSIDT